jgi:hypothetical protein
MSNLKIIVPLFVVAALVTVILPMLLIFFVNDIQTNVSVGEGSQSMWTVFSHGLTMIATIFAESSWVIGLILIIIAVVILFSGLYVVVKNLAN